jgi:preprotein translocase subunit SecF
MRIDYIKHRFYFYAVALALFVGSLAMPFITTVHLGIDMTGGTQSEFQYEGEFQKSQVESTVSRISEMPEFASKSAINTTSVYKVSGENIFVVEVGYNTHAGISVKDLDALKTEFQNKLTAELKKDANATLIRYVNIGESFGDYIKKTAYLTLAMIIVVISLYIAWAFRGTVEGFTSFSFGAVTAISLFHDIVIAF